jgi:hypothetical protein
MGWKHKCVFEENLEFSDGSFPKTNKKVRRNKVKVNSTECKIQECKI